MFQNFLFLGGLPTVEPAKISKLTQHLKQKLCPDLQILSFEMPLSPADQSMTLGCAFVELANQNDLEFLKGKADGFRVDKKTQIFALSFEEFELAQSLDLKTKPTLEDSKLSERPLPGDWILGQPSKFLGEYSTLHWDRSGTLFQEFSMVPIQCVAKRGNICDSTITWSPLGTWLVSFHVQGVALSLIKDGEVCKIMRLEHSNVTQVIFSPDESFMLTIAPIVSQGGGVKEDHQLALLWDIQSGDLIEKVQGSDFAWQSNRLAFANSKGDLCISQVSPSGLSIMHTFPRVQRFTWANNKPLIAFWAEPEQETSPARLCIWNCHKGEMIKSKTLFLLKSCHFHWHPADEYLGARVERWNKSRKTFIPSLEIFYLRQRDVPVENLDFPTGNVILDLDWDQGAKFAIIIQIDSKARVAFFTLGKQINPCGSFERKGVERLLWSPKGRFLVAWSASGAELWDGQEESLVSLCDHSAISHLQWHPMGLFFVTVCSHASFPSAENGFIIWDLKGAVWEKKSIDKFVSFLWRPLPPSCLDPERIRAISKGLKEIYWGEFEREDADWAFEHATSTSEKRKALRAAWRSWRDQCKARASELDSQRRELVGDEIDQQDFVEIEELVEQVVDEQIIYLS